MKQKYNYKWILSQNITPANVTKEYTMYYSPRFDQKNWTLMFLERYDESIIIASWYWFISGTMSN